MQRQELYNPERDRGKREYGATNVGEYSEGLGVRTGISSHVRPSNKRRPLFLLIPTIGKEDTPSDF